MATTSAITSASPTPIADVAEAGLRRRRWLGISLLATIAVLVGAYAVFRGDVIRYSLDPKVPFQTYKPPPAPDYATRQAWLLLPTRPDAPGPAEPAADVFFVSPTTFSGGKDWNAPPNDPEAERVFRQVMAPNYAGPFVRLGRIFAPRYRQAGLYSLMTLREDAREARKFAYADLLAAFRAWRERYGGDRPFILVGVEQGGTLAQRLLADEIAPDPKLRARLAAAYLVETAIPAAHPPLPPCLSRGQTQCLAAWVSAPQGDPARAQTTLDRALVWYPGGELDNLRGAALCFNPILGATTDALAPARLHQGAANATGFEWGARPAFLARQVSARCDGGVLRISEPKSASLRPSGSWIEQRRSPGYNLFYADLETDARARLAALTAR
ncbi:MAG: DUF3089 domain-containing protein [Phenylobacterium sp.]